MWPSLQIADSHTVAFNCIQTLHSTFAQVTALQQVPGISIMTALMAAAGIDSILDGEQVTIFAPTDDAMLQEAARRQLTVPQILNNSSLVNAIARCERQVSILYREVMRPPSNPSRSLNTTSSVDRSAVCTGTSHVLEQARITFTSCNSLPCTGHGAVADIICLSI